jgi:hypothetical protein
LIEEEMGNIIDVWDEERNIPPIEIEPSAQPNLKVYDVDEEKEDEEKEDQDIGKGPEEPNYRRHHEITKREKIQR